MTDFPPPSPADPPPDHPADSLPPAPVPFELIYETPPPTGNAPMLVRLAAIFNFVSAGLDVLNVIYRIGSLIVVLTMAARRAAAPLPPGLPISITQLQIILSVIPALFSLVAAAVKALGGYWLIRPRRLSWAAGLTAGIVGCLEFWSCPCCFLNLGVGVYTIVILCLQNVRDHLRVWAAPG